MKPLRLSIAFCATWCVLYTLAMSRIQGDLAPTLGTTAAVTVVILFPLTYFPLRKLARSKQMTSHEWTLVADGTSHRIELDHGYYSGRRVIRLDGETIHESARLLDSGSEHHFAVGAHECIVQIKPDWRRLGMTFGYDLVVDGVSRRTGEVVRTRGPNTSTPTIGPASVLTDSDRAARQIRSAWIAGAIFGFIKLVATLANSTGGDALGGIPSGSDLGWDLFEVALLLGLTLGIYKRNRVCAVLLFAYLLAGGLMGLYLSSTDLISLFAVLVFAWYFWMGVVGTFAHHKLLKASQATES